MQIAIQRKLTFFFAKGVFLLFASFLALTCLLLEAQYAGFFIFFIILACTTLTLGVSLGVDVWQFRSFNWGLEESQDTLSFKFDSNLALKACIRYRNRATYSMIRDELGLTQNTQVRRLIQEGLTILLKEHEEIKKDKT